MALAHTQNEPCITHGLAFPPNKLLGQVQATGCQMHALICPFESKKLNTNCRARGTVMAMEPDSGVCNAARSSVPHHKQKASSTQLAK